METPGIFMKTLISFMNASQANNFKVSNLNSSNFYDAIKMKHLFSTYENDEVDDK
jgi:hypothetical protein